MKVEISIKLKPNSRCSLENSILKFKIRILMEVVVRQLLVERGVQKVTILIIVGIWRWKWRLESSHRIKVNRLISMTASPANFKSAAPTPASRHQVSQPVTWAVMIQVRVLKARWIAKITGRIVLKAVKALEEVQMEEGLVAKIECSNFK